MKPLLCTTLAIALLIAACGYWQVLVLVPFWCGRVGAFPTIYPLTGFALAQLALFLSVSRSPRHRLLYGASQAIVVPFLALGLIQAFWPYPISACFLLAGGVLPVAVARYSGCAWIRRAPLAGYGVALTTVLGVLGAIVQIPLSMPDTVVTAPMLIGAVTAGLVAAVLALRHLDRYFGPRTGAYSALPMLPLPMLPLPMLPLSLLLLAVLRAKFPDASYDAFLYKATAPMQMADWRTGDMPIMDATMLGTNFQEMLNAALIMVTRDYLPPLVSTISFVLLTCITPYAFATEAEAPAGTRGIAAFAAAIAFTVTEAGIAQGTSYQEPLMLLFLTASLLPGQLWIAYLAVAAMVKINAGFIGPLVLFLHARRGWRDLISVRTAAMVVVSALVIVVPQFQRNVTFSGRLFGQSELLAKLTDPPGSRQIMVKGGSHFDGPIRGGPLNNAVQSACNMLLLDIACPTAEGSLGIGFHVFPGSRAPLLAILGCVALLVLVATRRTAAGPAIASIALYLLAYFLVLRFMSEGRYFLPLSFGFAVLLMVNRAAFTGLLQDGPPIGRRGLVLTAAAVFVIGSDLVPGMYTNVSWWCQRSLFKPAVAQDLSAPRTPTEAFLMDLAKAYRRTCPPPGLPPVILGQHDKLNAPYLGVQQSHFFLTHEMNARFYAADPARRAGIPRAVLAFAYVDPDTPQKILGDAAGHFSPCFSHGDEHVLCSKELAPAAKHCAESLFPGRTGTPAQP